MCRCFADTPGNRASHGSGEPRESTAKEGLLRIAVAARELIAIGAWVSMVAGSVDVGLKLLGGWVDVVDQK
jgi:hypothetical protein